MALTERSRNALYTGLTEIIHEEAVSEMLSYFPARDVEEPVTKEFLRAEMAELRRPRRDRRDARRDGHASGVPGRVRGHPWSAAVDVRNHADDDRTDHRGDGAVDLIGPGGPVSG